MTFRAFEQLVKAKYPEAEIFRHGEFAGNKINVAIVFTPHTKVYKYNGTYCDVLNRLGIKAIYSHDLENARRYLQHLKDTNGEENIFTGEAMDYTEDIAEYTARIETYEKEYVIV
jgi:hypothetical protein